MGPDMGLDTLCTPETSFVFIFYQFVIWTYLLKRYTDYEWCKFVLNIQSSQRDMSLQVLQETGNKYVLEESTLKLMKQIEKLKLWENNQGLEWL